MSTRHYLSSLVIFLGGIIDSQCCKVLSLTKWFFIQILIIHDNFSSQVADKRRPGFGQRMNSSIIHANICSLIHRKRHPKSYHSDIYTIFSVTTHEVNPPCQRAPILPCLQAQYLRDHQALLPLGHQLIPIRALTLTYCLLHIPNTIPHTLHNRNSCVYYIHPIMKPHQLVLPHPPWPIPTYHRVSPRHVELR